MSGFKVYLNGRYFDEVFFAKRMSCSDVERHMREEEGLRGNITVKPFRI